MTSSVVYYQTGQDVAAVVPNPARSDFYRDLLLVHGFRDVYGHVTADADVIIMAQGEVFYSTNGVFGPEDVRSFSVGSSDGLNGCWSPDPRNAVPEYVGVRFADPVRVTGFQFSSGFFNSDYCPFGYGPCAYPTDFLLQASNDESDWTTLYAAADFAGMRVASQSPFFDEGSSWWEDGVYLSDRLDIPNDHFYRSYRLVVTDFAPDRNGNYNISELIFYGVSA
jgi:hypothetical protein